MNTMIWKLNIKTSSDDLLSDLFGLLREHCFDLNRLELKAQIETWPFPNTVNSQLSIILKGSIKF